MDPLDPGDERRELTGERVQRAQQPAHPENFIGDSFTPPLLTRAAARAEPVTDSTTRALGKLLLAPDRAAKLNVLSTYQEQLASQRARDDLATIVQRLGGDTWFRQATPLLGELGAPGKAEFVLDFQKPESSPLSVITC
ncbi:hypothetical protein ACLQ24_26830 [Micromonospora sp. DT4]|uniref:hypothetical protein n=1 Tax=Micromonospora sp. DT4 TaxID=3393438 RepID=UPI003CEFB1C2